MLSFFPIADAEIAASLNGGLATLADLSIRQATKKLYSAGKDYCTDTTDAYNRKICLYLYLYAADSWCADDCCNVLSESEYLRIIGKIEELSTT